MGRRGRTSRFMPGVYVFPGGRAERADAMPSGFDETMALPPEGTDLNTRRRLVRFARTALRETFEETGLLVADPQRSGGAAVEADQSPRLAVWTASPIRFHTRFFRVDGHAARGELSGDGELEDLHWVTASDARLLPMSTVTTLVLREAMAHGPATRGGERPAAFFRWVGGGQWPRHAVGPAARRA